MVREDTRMNEKCPNQALGLIILTLGTLTNGDCSQGDSLPTQSPVAPTSTFETTPTLEVLTATGLPPTLEPTPASSGSAGDITVDANGASHAKLADLAVVDANVETRGRSHATVNPSGRLDAVARGALTSRILAVPP